MTQRTAAWLAWTIWSMSIVVGVAGPIMATRLWSPNSGIVHATFGETLLLVVLSLPILTVGALIGIRQPANRMGWLLLCVGSGWSLLGFSESYPDFARQAAAAPEFGWLVWIGYWSGGITILGMVVFLPLLFPNGRLPSPRWRPFTWLAIIATVLWMSMDAFGPDAARDPAVPNIVQHQTVADLLDTIGPLIDLLVGVVALGSAASLVVRFRRASGIERQQLKWIAYVVSVVAALFLLAGVTATLFSVKESGLLGAVGWYGAIVVSIVGLPVAIGIAVLRYRLYDIDRLINRTLVYGVLTLSLLITYLAVVFILGQMVRTVTGGSSSLVVAASTLAVAALFRPLRARIQSVVDRRFYRHKYDAARTLDLFSTRLREETDLDTLSSDLRQIVEQTMQPAHVSLWLRLPDRTAAGP